jgi:hypothetical protein
MYDPGTGTLLENDAPGSQRGAINFIDFQSGTGASFEGFKSFMFLLTSGG